MDIINWEGLCDYCIWIMECGSHEYHISYGFINVILFVILGPLSTICFGLAYLFERFDKHKVALVLAIIGTLVVLSVLIAVALFFISTVNYIEMK